MSIRLYGQWRLTVIEAIHNWDNRFVISEASSGTGIYPPTVGSTVNVNGESWLLDAQHQPPGEAWQSSAMIFELSVPEHVSIQATIGAEDPLPTEDYRDIRWQGVYLGNMMFDIPYRPYAVRTTDLFQMPDGVFEGSLGTYYMGVRVTNRWGMSFSENHVLDITQASRVALAAQGVIVIDEWSSAELASLGQRQAGTGMVLGSIKPGESRTVFFKVDVSQAPPRKHTVEFICRNTNGMADPGHPARRVSKSIYVSRTSYDVNTGEMVFDARQGSLRLKLEEVVYDSEGYRRNRRQLRAANGSAKGKLDLGKLRRALKELLEGKHVDLCEIQRLLACYCLEDEDEDSTSRPIYEPFYAFPTKFTATVIPRFPFTGQYGPLLYDDPWWKFALAVLAAILWLLGALEESGQSAYEDEDFVIGTLFDSQRHHLDAALCLIDTSRSLSFRTVLDAQSDEDNQAPVIALDGVVNDIEFDVMSEQDINDLFLEAANTGDTSVLRVFKSGLRTGLTFAEISRFSDPWVRCDQRDTSLADCPDDRRTRFDDPDRPTIEFTMVTGGDPNAQISDPGDSGSVWIHLDTRRIVALNHSGNDTTALGSLMAHIVDAFNISF